MKPFRMTKLLETLFAHGKFILDPKISNHALSPCVATS